MIKNSLLTILITVLFSFPSFTQEYSYTHYDINEGLAGSSAYAIAQDKEGFIWIGTETGLSRFDGTHFKNFTMADGLPDVEILQIFCDSKGRVWMAPFSKSVCYYYHNKIYNADNDSLLKKIRINQGIIAFAEDREGNILIQEPKALHLVENDGHIGDFDSIDHRPLMEGLGVSSSSSGHFLVLDKGFLYEWNKGMATPRSSLTTSMYLFYALNYNKVSPSWLIWRSSGLESTIRSITTGNEFHLPFTMDHVSYSIVNDSLLYMNSSNGSIEYDPVTGRKKTFLPGIEVSRVIRDSEGSLWFTTIGHGIFRLNSDEFRNLDLTWQGLGKSPVFSISKLGNSLFLGSGNSVIFRCSLPKLSYEYFWPGIKKIRNRIMYIGELKNNTLIVGSDIALYRAELLRNAHSYTSLSASINQVKTTFRKNERELLITGAEGCLTLDLETFRITDTLFHPRASAVFIRNDTTYIGTLNGLFAVLKDKSILFLGEKIPFFRNRISALAMSADSTLWVAAYNDGIAGYRNGRITTTFTSKEGLTSDICRNLLAKNETLWVGTDKGLNKIDLGKAGFPITRYTSNDGLGSDIINTVYVDSSMVYVGTPAGLSFFDESKTNISGGCRLLWLSLINSGHERLADTAKLRLTYKENNIRFEFAGISFKSVGNIQYKYRLLGLDSVWKDTKETYLEYPSLPSGNYEIQIEATNKFGVRSNRLSLPFIVTNPFWRTTWFDILFFLTLITLIWFYLNWRIKTIRQRQEEKENISKKVMEMEQMAMRAQMNPHFIFNCLNSIQQYIFNQDIFAANKYITEFAKLMRATLQNSTQSYITLEDEVAFLSTYLSLEKLRFKEKMNYSIEVDPSLSYKDVIIPPMLIQPYVENCMRHGIRHKSGDKGYIRIHVYQEAGKLIFIVEDNGIGREKASQYKTREHIEYQSKGMSLTADRIRLINSLYGNDITAEVFDLINERGQASGTRVRIQFPKFETYVQ